MNDPGEGQLPDAPQVELSTPPQIEISESAEQETPIFSTPAWHPFQERIPHIGHVFLLFLLLILGVVGASLVTVTEVRFHLFGLASMKDVAGNARVALIAQGSIYLIAFALSLLLFPPLWNQGFFAGIEWNGRKALSLFKRLFASAFACFLLALLNEALFPVPDNTPIDKLLGSPGAPWLLFAFGVTFAPFFEEIAFRGFLLPALCTAGDWAAERYWGMEPRPLDAAGHPKWSLGSMVIASICTSLPFALLHAEQTGHAIGPFVMLVGVSLVLCWTRLSTRSLSASVLVHASYNFLLFFLMMLGTGGFRHMDKM